MANAVVSNEPGHITRGDVLADLGFTAEEIRETEIKMTIWRPLRDEIEGRGLSQAGVSELLQIHQPDASLLVRGRLSKFSVMKLMQFAEKLGLSVQLKVNRVDGIPRSRTRISRSTSLTARRVKADAVKARAKAVA